jgi:cytochrome c biogenesis protein ResB
VGLVVTFYFSRRRVWVRIDGSGELRLAWSSDRYVSVRRELGGLLTDLVRVRTATPPDPADPAPPSAAG